ncbi:MAG: hypothetical protein KGO49_07720 [Gammaproteobacteria bacterium]|nr:hypothetical protein [Gammaproteobacteria bacterium]
MKLSKKLASRHLAVAALVIGVSAPLYAMADTPSATETAAKVMADTTTTVKHKAHRAEHKARAAVETKAEAVKTDADAAKKGAEKRVVWKNGVVFHDVEPSGQATSSFTAPSSTSDTLQGGVTTTPAH